MCHQWRGRAAVLPRRGIPSERSFNRPGFAPERFTRGLATCPAACFSGSPRFIVGDDSGKEVFKESEHITPNDVNFFYDEEGVLVLIFL